MMNPEIIQIISVEINTDHAKDSESVKVYPDLLQFLKQNQRRQMRVKMPCCEVMTRQVDRRITFI